MTSRENELQAKKARLAELKRQRELRNQDPARWRQSKGSTVDDSASSPARSGERRAQVEELVSTLIGANPESSGARFDRRTDQPSSNLVSSIDSTTKASERALWPEVHSIATQTFTSAPTSTVFEVTPETARKVEYITYSKGVQTEALDTTVYPGAEQVSGLATKDEPVQGRDHGKDSRDEEIRARLRREIEGELKSASNQDLKDHTSLRVQRDPLRTLSSDELNAVTSSNDFSAFVERSSKVIERALDEEYDLLADYTVSNTPDEGYDDGDNGSHPRLSRKAYSLNQTHQFFDIKQSRRRQISDLQFSPHFGELLLSSHTKNPTAINDPSGLIMLWNVHAPSRPEYTFHSQGADILSARFSPFHPNLIIGGCFTGQVCLWDTRSTSRLGGAPVLKTPQSGSNLGHNHPIHSISIVGTPNAHNIITASSDGVVCSWSVDMLTQPQEYLELATPPPSKTEDLAPTCMAFPSSDPTFFLVGTEEGSIYPCHRYDRAGAKAGVDAKLAYKSHAAPVMSAQFHPAKGPADLSDILLTSSVDWSVKLWRVKPAVSPSSVATVGATTATRLNGVGGPQPITRLLDIEREDLVYDAKWAPHKPSVFACVTGAGDLEIFDINMDLEVPVARASPTRGKGGVLVDGLSKCAWEEKRGGLIATGGLDGVVSVFEVGKGMSGESRPDEWTAMKKNLARAEFAKK